MTKETALVDDVRSIARTPQRVKNKREQAAEAAINVRFARGAAGRLDPASNRDRVWAEVLESLRDSRQPAYVEIDPDTRYITSLLLPQKLAVTAIRELPNRGDLEIELEISQARHYLRRDHPRFDEWRGMLERARRERTPVLVTESLDSTAIVDLRPAPPAGAARRKVRGK